MKTLLFACFAASSLGFAAAESAEKLSLEARKTNVEFLALANPGSLKIRGKVNPDDKEAVKAYFTIVNLNLTGTAKVQLSALDTGIEMRDQHMKEKHLQTAAFPSTELTISKMVLPETFKQASYSGKEIPFEGTLVLHGAKKEVKGTANVKKSDSNVEIELDFGVKMTEFGMEQPKFMGISVDNDVKVTASLAGVITKL